MSMQRLVISKINNRLFVLVAAAIFLPQSVMAASLYERAFEDRYNNPTSRAALDSFASSAVNAGQYDQALSTLEQILFEDPNDIGARISIARIYYHVGSFDLALAHANEALALATGTDFEREIIELQELIEKAQKGVRTYVDFTLGVDYSWFDEDSLSGAVTQPVVRAEGASGFASVDGVVEVDLKTASRDLLVFAGGVAYSTTLADLNFNSTYDSFEAGSGYAAVTFSKGLPDLIDTLRVDASGYAEWSEQGANRVRREYGVRSRVSLRPTVETAVYTDFGYAWLNDSSNLFADNAYFYGLGFQYRFAPGWTLALDVSRKHTQGFVPVAVPAGSSLDYDVTNTAVNASVSHLLHVFADGRSWFHQLSGRYETGDALDYGTVMTASPSVADVDRWRIDWDHTVQTSTNGKVSFGLGYRNTSIDRGALDKVDRDEWTVRARYTYRFQ